MLRIFSILSIVLLCVSSFSVQASVKEHSVSGIGEGSSRSEALLNALGEAVGRAFGIDLNAATFSRISETETTDQNYSSMISEINQRISLKVKTPDNNPILGYSVTRSYRDDTGHWEVEVDLRYAQYTTPGIQTSRRSVIVVVPNHSPHAELVKSTVEKSLVRSRRFDVLDRDNLAFFQKEKEFILSSDAGSKEIARLGNASGADYLIIAGLDDLSISNNQREVIRLTGEVLVHSKFSGALRMEIVEFTSREVKWSESSRLGGTYQGVSSIGKNILSKEITRAADSLITSMLDAIYPIRIVKVRGDLAIINRGQGAVYKNDKFHVFLLGDELIDPQSGESLGREETKVATGVVTEVKPKFAYLRIKEGQLNQSGNYLLREAE